jgi:HAD superfamily hydrolase (TIGR01549 family)
MVCAIFFDLDGTLCTLKRPFQEIFSDSFKPLFKRHPDISYETIHEVWRRVLHEETEMHTLKAIQQTLHHLHLEIPPGIEEMVDRFQEAYSLQICAKEDLCSILPALSQKYSLGIITNGPSDLQEGAIRALGISEWIEHVVISGDSQIAVRKPNPEIFVKALQPLGIVPEEAVMVGDSLEVDIHTPQKLGFHTLFLGKFGELLKTKSGQLAQCINTLSELAGVLDNHFGAGCKVKIAKNL